MRCALTACALLLGQARGDSEPPNWADSTKILPIEWVDGHAKDSPSNPAFVESQATVGTKAPQPLPANYSAENSHPNDAAIDPRGPEATPIHPPNEFGSNFGSAQACSSPAAACIRLGDLTNPNSGRAEPSAAIAQLSEPAPSPIAESPPDADIPAFSIDSNGFDFPFRFGFGGGIPTLNGFRMPRAGFDPVAAERFPEIDQAGMRGSVVFELGTTFRTDRIGTFTFGYRVNSGNEAIAYVTPNTPMDPLVVQFLKNSSNDDDTVPTILTVPDSVGSCVVSSRLAVNQLDLAWSPPALEIGNDLGIFGQIGARGVSFFHEDYTNSAAIFQQAKDSFYGAGPVAGFGVSFRFSHCQFYCKADAGDLFGAAHQFDREMAILDDSTRIVSASADAARSVPTLGIEAGFVAFQSARSSVGVSYRFDQWWHVGGFDGNTLDFNNHCVMFDVRWGF